MSRRLIKFKGKTNIKVWRPHHRGNTAEASPIHCHQAAWDRIRRKEKIGVAVYAGLNGKLHLEEE